MTIPRSDTRRPRQHPRTWHVHVGLNGAALGSNVEKVPAALQSR